MRMKSVDECLDHNLEVQSLKKVFTDDSFSKNETRTKEMADFLHFFALNVRFFWKEQILRLRSRLLRRTFCTPGALSELNK